VKQVRTGENKPVDRKRTPCPGFVPEGLRRCSSLPSLEVRRVGQNQVSTAFPENPGHLFHRAQNRLAEAPVEKRQRFHGHIDAHAEAIFQ